jgi:hypothetical protein
MASLTNPFDAMDFGTGTTTSTTTTTTNNNNNGATDDFDLMAAFGGPSTSTTSNTTTSTAASSSGGTGKAAKPPRIKTEGMLAGPGVPTDSPKSSRSERRRRMSRKGSRSDSATSITSTSSMGGSSSSPRDSFDSTPDPFEEEDTTLPAQAMRRGSVAKEQPGMRGLRMSFNADGSAQDFVRVVLLFASSVLFTFLVVG